MKINSISLFYTQTKNPMIPKNLKFVHSLLKPLLNNSYQLKIISECGKWFRTNTYQNGWLLLPL